MKNHYRRLIAAFAFVASGWLATTSITSADALPPRPTAVPTIAPPEAVNRAEDAAYIELRIPGAAPGMRIVVQWQDPAGGWHTVEGWQHPLDEHGFVRWGVYPRDMGSGPFRWALLAGDANAVTHVSERFWLPAHRGQVHVVTHIAATK